MESGSSPNFLRNKYRYGFMENDQLLLTLFSIMKTLEDQNY